MLGFEKKLKLSDQDYRNALMLFYIPYIAIELPSNWLLKKIGASNFLPAIVILWGLVTLCQAFVVNRGELFAVRYAFWSNLTTNCLQDRILLGAREGALLPGIMVYMAQWYKVTELHWTFGLFGATGAVGCAVGGLFASALGLLAGKGGLAGWSWVQIPVEQCSSLT